MLHSPIPNSLLYKLKQSAACETTPQYMLRELAQSSIELARIVAGNHLTSPQLLEELSSSRDREILAAVTANPNTPPKILLDKLCCQFPQEFLSNSILPLLFIENQNFASSIPKESLIQLLQIEELPELFLVSATSYKDEEVLLMMVNNPNISRGVLTKLSQCSDYPHVQDSAKFHINGQEIAIAAPTEEANKAMLRNYLPHPYYYEEEFAELGAVPEFLIPVLYASARCQVAKHPRTKLEVLKKLARDENEYVRIAVGSNPNIPLDLLMLWTQEQDIFLSAGVASNPNTPVDLLEKWTFDEDEKLRIGVASNPNSPAYLLELLVRDEDLDVRYEVAKNPSTPLTLLRYIATHEESEYVCGGLVKNPNSSSDVLQMVSDKLADKYLCQQLANHPNISEYTLSNLAYFYKAIVREAVACNDKTSVETLQYLATDRDDDVRACVAANERTPIELLRNLALDKSTWVRASVASNPKTPFNLLEKLALDKNASVRCGVVKNLKVPKYLLAILNQDANQEVRQALVLRGVVEPSSDPLSRLLTNASQIDTPCFSRLLALLHPSVPVSGLIKHYSSSAWLERYAIAQHPKTPQEIIQHLQQDVNLVVRAAARLNLQKRLVLQQPNLLAFPTVKDDLLEWAANQDCQELLLGVVMNTRIDRTILEKLIESKYPLVRAAAELHINWVESSKLNESAVVQQAILQNNLPSNAEEEIVLARLGMIPESLLPILSESTRCAIANNPDTPADLLHILADSESEIVRSAVARNLNAPAVILAKLARDQHQSVRIEVAKNINTSVKRLKTWVKSKDEYLRVAVATNPNLPINLLRELSQDEALNVRKAVASNPKLPMDLLLPWSKSENVSLRSGVAQNYNTPVNILRQLARDKEPSVRTSVASNPNTPANVLAFLARDEYFNVRIAIANNPSTSPGILATLADDKNRLIERSLANNPNTPLQILESLASEKEVSFASNPKIPAEKLFEKILTDISLSEKPTLTRLLIFLFGQINSSILANHSHSLSWLERYAIAQNQNTPREIVSHLAQDANFIVRSAAQNLIPPSIERLGESP